jgi:glyceraldehyde 3-phosphate dehydrogenase
MSFGDAESYLEQWNKKEQASYKMVSIIGQLWHQKGVRINFFKRKLVDKSSSQLLNIFQWSKQLLGDDSNIEVFDCLLFLECIKKMDLDPCIIDIGKLMLNFSSQKGQLINSWTEKELSPFLKGKSSIPEKHKDVVLYGFGRIGRIVARQLVQWTGSGHQLRLRGIVVRPGSREDLLRRVELFSRDSLHGEFVGTIQVLEDEKILLINGSAVHIFYANSPEDIKYSDFGIVDPLLIDNTGKWRTSETLEKHIKQSGAESVLLTAPGKDNIPNIVYGVNHKMAAKKNIVSAASCTTNAIVPILKVVNDKWGIDFGHIETVHSYTNDQNLLDNFHKKQRRGRAAPLNMVITETGAAKAVSLAVPELAGKLTANAIRVPTPNVSLAVCNLTLEEEVTLEELNSKIREISLFGELVQQIEFTAGEEVVSSDLVGNDHPSIFDSKATIVDGKRVVLYIWYDNEWGYSAQVIRLAKYITDLHLPRYE